MTDKKCMHSIRTMMGTIVVTLVVTGCATTSHHRVSGKELEARLVCNHFVKMFKGSEKAFNLARFKADNDLTNLFCIWNKGLILPTSKMSGDVKYPLPYTLPKPKPVRHPKAKGSK